MFALLILSGAAWANDDPHTLEKIAASLTALRDRPRVVSYETEVTHLWPHGSENQRAIREAQEKQLATDLAAIGTVIHLPPQDITFNYVEKHVYDFADGKTWGKGFRPYGVIEWDSQARPSFRHWLTYSEAVVTPREICSSEPHRQERILKTDSKAGVCWEFLHSHRDGGGMTEEAIPVFYCEAELPSPAEDKFVRNLPVLPRLTELWVRDPDRDDPRGWPALRSTNIKGMTFRCVLRPDLH